MVVWCGTQTPHRLRDELARVLRIDVSRVRVITPDHLSNVRYYQTLDVYPVRCDNGMSVNPR
jgi:hypothetical protein